MNQTIVLSCFVFILFLILLPGHPLSMFGDPDTFWHLAAGDLIRAQHAIPAHDTWSSTAGDERWFNIAWGWDTMISWLYNRSGWPGLIAMNSLTIAAELSLVFAACFVRSRHGIAAFMTVLLVGVAMVNTNIRPFQITYLFTALLAFLLPQIMRGACSVRWLLVVPLLMLLWVNVHGGFLMGFFLLGVYGAEALWRRNWHLTRWLLASGILSFIACVFNPYGVDIAVAALHTLTVHTLQSAEKPFLTEWQPLVFSFSYFMFDLYVFLFFALVLMRRIPALTAEKIIAYSWSVLGLTSIRHLNIFAIVSAPMLATGLRDVMAAKVQKPIVAPAFVHRWSEAASRAVNTGCAAYPMLGLSALVSVFMFMPPAVQAYRLASFTPPPNLTEEIAFLETHYPHARLLTEYSLGGPLIFDTRGKIPVFIDGRAETAYPQEVVRDYVAFHTAEKGWEKIIDRYRIDGVIFPLQQQNIMDRFVDRRGWRLVFKGKTAAIFMRDKS